MAFNPAKGINADKAYGQYLQSHGNRGFDWRWPAMAFGGQIAGAAAPALAGLFSGGAAASGGSAGLAPIVGGSPWAVTPLAGAATSGTAAATAGAAGGASRLSSLFSSPLAGTLAQGAFSYGAQRGQNKANENAMNLTLKSQADALAVERQRLELEAKNADLDRADAKALNDAINALKKRELDLTESVRLFDQEQYMKSEARREPYRQRGAQALDRLAGMWSLG